VTEKDYRRIRLGEHEVGVFGLGTAMQNIAEAHCDSSSANIQRELLDRLSADNYIPRAAREEYGKAFEREFLKFLGKAYEDLDEGPVRIVLVGGGCFLCDQLEQSVMKSVDELGLPAAIEQVAEVTGIPGYESVRIPAIIINDNVVVSGYAPNSQEVKELLSEFSSDERGNP
jgi:Thioredoxin domain